MLGKTDRRESLRADRSCMVRFGDGRAVDVVANVSLSGCLVADGHLAPVPAEGELLQVEFPRPGKPVLAFRVRATRLHGARPGVFLRFDGPGFDEERTLARLLDSAEPDVDPLS
ncbi:MAG: PilZ domain-containing protein [Myxococcota bacterium]